MRLGELRATGGRMEPVCAFHKTANHAEKSLLEVVTRDSCQELRLSIVWKENTVVGRWKEKEAAGERMVRKRSGGGRMKNKTNW